MSTIHRHRSQELKYRKHLKNNSVQKQCIFCAFSKKNKQFIKETTYFWEVKNIFPYTLWDSCKVIAHNMLVPKRHIISLAELQPAELKEYTKIISQKEKEGYDVYSRGKSSHMKSIPHQHTHFIKTNHKKIKRMFYNDTPLITYYK